MEKHKVANRTPNPTPNITDLGSIVFLHYQAYVNLIYRLSQRKKYRLLVDNYKNVHDIFFMHSHLTITNNDNELLGP